MIFTYAQPSYDTVHWRLTRYSYTTRFRCNANLQPINRVMRGSTVFAVRRTLQSRSILENGTERVHWRTITTTGEHFVIGYQNVNALFLPRNLSITSVLCHVLIAFGQITRYVATQCLVRTIRCNERALQHESTEMKVFLEPRCRQHSFPVLWKDLDSERDDRNEIRVINCKNRAKLKGIEWNKIA